MQERSPGSSARGARPARFLVVLGTRPEAIKLARVVHALEESFGPEAVVVCSTGQHRELVHETAAALELGIDRDLDLMRPGQRLLDLLGRLGSALTPVLDEAAPDVVVVQGDTLTAMGAALGAFLEGIPVAHVEAGLRTADRRVPFPEEMNRRLVGRLADWHFAPTEGAREALLAEGVDPGSVLVTGNSGIDALLWMRERVAGRPLPVHLAAEERLVLVTAHRRESFGAPLRSLCAGLRGMVEDHPDVRLVLPVHPNPNVRGPVEEALAGLERAHLLAPLSYPDLVQLLAASTLVVTDSGGLQEEAPTLGVPVLVLRDATERPEAVAAGATRLVGTDADAIRSAAAELLGDPRRLAAASRPRAVYGDGRAAERIREAFRGGVQAVEPFRWRG